MDVMKLKITKEEYSKLTDELSPNSKSSQNIFKAFISGGLICAFAQVIAIIYERLGIEEKTTEALVPCTIIVIAAILTAMGKFDKLARHAGAGTLVPITGFANSIVSPAMEFQSEGRILGTGANMFKIAGPVLVYGSSASVIYGIIFYICTLIK